MLEHEFLRIDKGPDDVLDGLLTGSSVDKVVSRLGAFFFLGETRVGREIEDFDQLCVIQGGVGLVTRIDLLKDVLSVENLQCLFERWFVGSFTGARTVAFGLPECFQEGSLLGPRSLGGEKEVLLGELVPELCQFPVDRLMEVAKSLLFISRLILGRSNDQIVHKAWPV